MIEGGGVGVVDFWSKLHDIIFKCPLIKKGTVINNVTNIGGTVCYFIKIKWENGMLLTWFGSFTVFYCGPFELLP